MPPSIGLIPESTVLVILGASGDLAKKKLVRQYPKPSSYEA